MNSSFLTLCFKPNGIYSIVPKNKRKKEEENLLSFLFTLYRYSSPDNYNCSLVDPHGFMNHLHLWIFMSLYFGYRWNVPYSSFNILLIYIWFLSLLDGKSNDLLTMKQNKEEWVEYKSVMEDVVNRSRLDKSIFFDLRGNHDNFGVPAVGGSYDFFSKYSINGQLGRSSNVNSITLRVSSPFNVGLYMYASCTDIIFSSFQLNPELWTMFAAFSLLM